MTISKLFIFTITPFKSLTGDKKNFRGNSEGKYTLGNSREENNLNITFPGL